MNILITGSNGQLGNSIQKIEGEFPSFRFFYTDLPDLDITDDQKVVQTLEENQIHYVINCAAYTAVDQAEKETELAFKVNETGPATLARSCQFSGARLIHISTDYVFSGKHYRPYKPEDQTQPESTYGKSKEAGEIAVMNYFDSSWIIRTSWLYSEFGNNFVKTMIRLGQERESLNVVADQIGSPTYAEDLARAALLLVKRDVDEPEKITSRIFHYANQGIASWYDFSRTIMDVTKLNCTINPIPTEHYPLPAPRPFYSVMDTSLIKSNLELTIPYWRESLIKCIQTLLK